MKTSIVLMLAMVTALSSGFLLLEDTPANARAADNQQKVNANLYRVKVDGNWHEVPMMPLSDSTCRSPSRLIQPYCH